MTQNYLPRSGWGKILVCGAYAALAYAALVLLGRLLPACAPFICAGALAWALSRPIGWLTRHTRLPRGFISVILCTCAIALICAAVFFAAERAADAAEAVIDYLDRSAKEIERGISEIGAALRERFPSVGGTMAEEALDALISGAASRAIGFVTDAAASAVSGAPSALLFIIVTVIASFYFACGYSEISGYITSRLPAGFVRWKKTVRRTVWAYLRCALICAAAAFAITGAGLLILRARDPWLTALICAAVDLLPVFGAGTVLVPWAVIKLIGGETSFGIGLAAIYGVCVIVREVLEPRLMAGSFGLHPAVSLASMYLGFRFFGFAGMIFLPVAVSAIASGAAPHSGE